MQRNILHLLLLGVFMLLNLPASAALGGSSEKDLGKQVDATEPLHDQLNTVFKGIKTPESKSLLQDLLGKEPADKFDFLQKVKDSFFVKLYAAKKEKIEKKDAKVSAPIVETEALVALEKPVSTADNVPRETAPLPIVTGAPIVTTFSPVPVESSLPVTTEGPAVNTAPTWHETLIPNSHDTTSRSFDCKFQAGNGTPPKNFISDVLDNWLETKNGLPNGTVTPDDAIKKVFVSEIRKQFPKEILSGLGLGEYVELLFSYENVMSLDETLSKFSEMYTVVLEALGLETTEFEPNSSNRIEADAISNKLWAKIGQTTVTPFLEETFSKPCLKNEKSLPSADSAMKLILELPLDVTNGLVSRSDGSPNNIPLVFDHQMNGAEIFSKAKAFVNSLPQDVMDEVVREYARNKPFVEHVYYEDLKLLAKKDLIEYVTMLTFAPTDDLTNYFTGSIKDSLYFTFSLSNIDESIGSVPGLRELIDRIMQMPSKYLKLLVKKVSFIIKKTFKLFAKVDFLKNKVDLIKNKFSKPMKMLTTLPFESTYDMYSLNKKALEKSDTVDLTTTEQSEKSLISFLGLEDYNLSYDTIVAFLTEFAQLSNDAALAVFDDLSVRLNPFSAIAKETYEKEQRVTKKINDLYEKYDIANASKRLSNKLMSLVGLDGKPFNVTTTPAPPSFFERFNTELKRFPDNLLLSFRNPFSWGKNQTNTPIDRADVIVPDESMSAKELLQVFYNFLNESVDLEENQKIRLVTMLSSKIKTNVKPSLTKEFTSHLFELGYWFGNTTNEVVGELANWWSGENQDDQSEDESKFKSMSFEDKISQMENMKRLFMEQNGFTHLSQKGKEEVHKAVKSMSSLINWNKPNDAIVLKPNFSGSKYNPSIGDGVKTFDISSKFNVNNLETAGVREKSDSVEPEFVEEIHNVDLSDLIARYKMLKFPVTLMNNVKKQLLTAIKESEKKANYDGEGKILSKWDKLMTKFGYPLPETYAAEPKAFKVRRAVPEDVLTQRYTEATIELEQFLSLPNAKEIAFQYLTEKEEENDLPGDSVVAIMAKFFNIR